MRMRAQNGTQTATPKCVFLWSFVALLLMQSPLLAGQSAERLKNAQNESSEPVVTFSTRSELVLVPVVVNDHKGAHVPGLTKDDFSLIETGSDRKIAIFEEVVANNDRIAARKLGESVFSNDRGVTSAKRLVILALDAINTPINDQIRARKQMLKFLSQGLDRDELISVVVLTPAGVKVVHDFTTDTSLLISAVSRLSGKSTFAEQNSQTTPTDETALQSEVAQLDALNDTSSQSAVAGQQQLAIRWTYDALTQIAHAYAGVPGRKSLIWLTAGFPFSLSDNNNQIYAVGASGDVSDNLDAYEQMWQALTQANFAVYPVDARGLSNSAVLQASEGARSVGAGKMALPNLAIAKSSAHDASLDTFRDLADMTGGKAFFNTNDLSKSFHEASIDSASYYLLGFYLPKDAHPGWHDLKVKVHRSGTQARSRSGYLVATKNETRKDRTDEIRSVIMSPFDSTALPVEIRWATQTRAPGAEKTTASFDVMLVPADVTVDQSDNNHMKFRIVAVARQSDGSVAGTVERSFDAHVTAANAAKFERIGMYYSGKFELPTGQYQVRFVVADSLSGRVGSVSAPLTIK